MTTSGLRGRLIPTSQRRTLDELAAELDLSEGDRAAKRSAFWTMLTLSAVIASAGVLADSTATVIGAMIIAPLSTPIMGIALDVVRRQRTAAPLFVGGGVLLVVAVGVLFSFTLPSAYDLLANSQVAGRTSPGVFDMIAALGTGLAGAVALARRDVAAILPGVAIAISLVPPLAVAGVCLGQGDPRLALGAGLLFLSNVLAMVLAGTLVFAALGYATAGAPPGGATRRAYLTVTVLLVVVALPLVGNSLTTLTLSTWARHVQQSAQDWADAVPGAEVTSVDSHLLTFTIHVRTPGRLPPTDELKRVLDQELPPGFGVQLETTAGETVDLGTTERP